MNSYKLTICIPTRNRLVYLKPLLYGLIKELPSDTQIVIGDNSDVEIFSDINSTLNSQIKYLAPAASVLTMVENWNRCASQAEGEWVVFIGDDDYIEPRLSSVIRQIERLSPKTNGIKWAITNYDWSDNRKNKPSVSSLDLSMKLSPVDKEKTFLKMFGWPKPGARASGMGVYHGALKLDVLNKIKNTYGDYFCDINPDYESSAKGLLHSTSAIYISRMLSIYGAGAASNSAISRSLEKMKILAIETGSDALNDSPLGIPREAGIAPTVANTYHKFMRQHNIEIKGWEVNFVKSCVHECQTALTEEEFIARKENYIFIFSKWQSGAYLQYFQEISRITSDLDFRGFKGERLYIDNNLSNESCADFYNRINCFLFPVELIGADLSKWSS